MIPWLLTQLSSATALEPTPDVIVAVRADVGTIRIRVDVGTIEIRPDTSTVEI